MERRNVADQSRLRSVGWIRSVFGWDEPASQRRALRVETKTCSVDGDVVVIPTQRREVLSKVASALGPRLDMVRLESVAGGAGVDHAARLAPEDESSRCGGYGS